FFFQAEDGIRDRNVTGVQTCALPIYTYPLLIAISAALGIVLQVHLRKLDPLSAMVDSSIWVVVCYTICAFLLFHVISLHLIKLLLRIAETYYKSIKISKTWHLYFISGYFLVLYGFLYCLSLWM